MKLPKRKYGKRWGRFYIAMPLFQSFVDDVSAGKGISAALSQFMGQVLIVKAEAVPDRDVIEYVGVSPLFSEIEEGEDIPEYTVNFKKELQCDYQRLWSVNCPEEQCLDCGMALVNALEAVNALEVVTFAGVTRLHR